MLRLRPQRPSLSMTAEVVFDGLRQVVAERGQEHVLVGIGRAAHAVPQAAANIGILRPPLQPAFGAVVKLDVEARRKFREVLGVVVAAGGAAGGKSTGARKRLG